MRNSSLNISCIAILILLAACAGAEHVADGSQRITSASLMRDVEALSADDMEGRRTGTPGIEKAAAYIEGRFRQIGLEPVAGSYRQTVNLVGLQKDGGHSWLTLTGPRGDLDYENDVTFTYWSTAQKEAVDVNDAPVIFVGYGVEAPEYDWDDFKGAEMKDAVLLFLNDDPPVSENGAQLFGGEARTYYGRWTYKFEQAMKHGAAGALVIHTTGSASYPFSVPAQAGGREHWSVELPGSGYQVDLLGWVDSTTAETIAADMGTTLAGLFEMGARREFAPRETGYTVTGHIETKIRRVETDNVLGLLAGSDPELAEQVIVFTAHYDHLGVREEVEGDDKIFNGAWDNAAGTSAIINLAAAFTDHADRPRRSLLFLACTAEEGGLNGSKWFATRPPFERSRLVANFNIDMPQIFGVTADLATIGVENSTLGDALRDAAGEFTLRTADGSDVPLTVTGDPDPAAGSFYRSDQLSFAKVGIPALALRPGVDYAQPLEFDPREYRSTHYHQVSDEVREEWDLSGLERDLRVVFKTALSVANADAMPRWTPGNEFEDEWKELHGFDR